MDVIIAKIVLSLALAFSSLHGAGATAMPAPLPSASPLDTPVLHP